jgi:hypothetical protein
MTNRFSQHVIQIKAAISSILTPMNAEEMLVPIGCNGTLEHQAAPLPPAVVETMKIVFRETHGAEMTPEDREFLGIADQ